MYFDKLHHPANFRFAERYHDGLFTAAGVEFQLELTAHLGDVTHLLVRDPKSPGRFAAAPREASLTPPAATAQAPCVRFGPEAQLSLASPAGELLLSSGQRGSFGFSGGGWMFEFQPDSSLRFFGLGEKWGPLEKTGTKTKFWNTDVWSDFAMCACHQGAADPVYASIPYLICQKGSTYFGILLDTPFAAFMAINASFALDGSPKDPTLFLGADGGEPSLYFIVGPTLQELTCKFQQLVGVTPRPPLWSLGHHQSRWGYGSRDDLLSLAQQFQRFNIPNDGLWLDIDYMDGYRVFTHDRTKLGSVDEALAQVSQQGQRVVAIVDPGIKREPGYEVFDEGLAGNHFCQTPEGIPFTGFVWPGATHFPDFAKTETKAWWAQRIAAFLALGFDGLWLDMNDPSVGRVELSEMLFDNGTLPHAAYHNQYALGMTRASHAGCLQAGPDQRPFLLTRGASTGIGRFAAVWTGDNFSNETFLRLCIPTTLNLALSGVPFNGPDVPGFGGDASDDLMQRWYKACFLFPFLRNHSCHGTRCQEPWALSKETLRVVRRYIRLRYKLLPYLYNLFVAQEAEGEAILRPLVYDFPHSPVQPTAAGPQSLVPSTSSVPIEASQPTDQDDAFMVGPALLQAPCLDSSEQVRTLSLPAGRWFDASRGRWWQGLTTLALRDKKRSTPLFVRDGSLVPMQLGKRTSNNNDLGEIELHVFMFEGTAQFRYEFDDGVSFGYRRGQVTRVELTVHRELDTLELQIDKAEIGYLPLRLRLVIYPTPSGTVNSARLVSDTQPRQLKLQQGRQRLTGKKISVVVSEPFTVA